jgi:hypothetical protein
MKIPPTGDANANLERESFYSDVANRCMKSAEKRRKTYALLQHYYTHGCAPEEEQATHNKIFAIVDTLTAFLYSADTTRFSGHLPPDVNDDEWDKVPAVSKAMNSEWMGTGADLVFSEALDLSMVYGSMFGKWVVNDGRLVPYSVEPHCVGVYREDVNGLDRQEAICHVYYITKTQLESELADHPQKQKILDDIAAKPIATSDEIPARLRQIIVTNTIGSGPLTPGNTVRGNGAPAWGATEIDYTPDISVDLVEMCELWIWNDDIKDYQTVTMADGRITVYDRSNIFVAKIHPFTQICPSPRKGYFWGDIIISRLIGLQYKRNRALIRIDDFLDKQVNPPRTLEGFSGPIDEIDLALDKAGGTVPLGDNPMAKVNLLKRDVPSDLWADVREIDEMFSEAAALPPLLQGRGESGVRSGRQTSELSRLGSSRIKKRALIVEDCLEFFATKGFKAMRKYHPDKYQTEPTKPGVKPMPFILAQVDEGLIVKVDAHSNSPLFVEDQKALAGEMLETKSIDRASFIEMLNPPMKDVLLRRLKTIEAKEIAAAKANADHEQQIEAQKHQPKPPPGLSAVK